ncbi:MAG: 1-acyl-sn-glycerol-3-phosphate acyltransferase [Chloroflexi bacterium]|nr:1-acyl-sn-glycerol-3-phosphate acyltransferase [Chloroflexota bacterium]
MSTDVSLPTLPDIVQQQGRYGWRRKILRDGLLRPIGFHVIVRPTITGLEHVPASGPTLVVINHIGFPDPVVVAGAVTSRYVIPMSKIENFGASIPGLIAWLWGAYPVDRGKVDRQALENTIALLKAGYCILIAPEGTRQSTMVEVKEGFTYVAIKSGATIVPIGLEGTHLVGGNMRRLRRTPIEIRFGPAFRFKTEGRSHVPRPEMRQMTQEAMYQLAQLVNPERRGFYADLSQATTGTLEFVS